MKNVFYLLFFLVLLMSCTVNKKPVFKKIDNIKVSQYAADTIKLRANAFFENPNTLGGKISTENIAVYVNNNNIATVSSTEVKVPAKKEFSIPLLVSIPTKKIWENNKSGILSGLLNSLMNKSIKIQFKGELKYKVFGFSKYYPINTTQEIKF